MHETAQLFYKTFLVRKSDTNKPSISCDLTSELGTRFFLESSDSCSGSNSGANFPYYDWLAGVLDFGVSALTFQVPAPTYLLKHFKFATTDNKKSISEVQDPVPSFLSLNFVEHFLVLGKV